MVQQLAVSKVALKAKLLVVWMAGKWVAEMVETTVVKLAEWWDSSLVVYLAAPKVAELVDLLVAPKVAELVDL